MAFIKSKPVLLAALRRPAIAELSIVRSLEDSAAWLEANLNVSFLGETDILRVSLDGTEAMELALLVNAVKDAYMEEEVNGQRKLTPPREGRGRLKVELQTNKPRVSVLNPAAVPTQKNLLEKARLVGFVGALGLFLGLFSVCFLESRSHCIRSKDEAAGRASRPHERVALSLISASSRVLQRMPPLPGTPYCQTSPTDSESM